MSDSENQSDSLLSSSQTTIVMPSKSNEESMHVQSTALFEPMKEATLQMKAFGLETEWKIAKNECVFLRSRLNELQALNESLVRDNILLSARIASLEMIKHNKCVDQYDVETRTKLVEFAKFIFETFNIANVGQIACPDESTDQANTNQEPEFSDSTSYEQYDNNGTYDEEDENETSENSEFNSEQVDTNSYQPNQTSLYDITHHHNTNKIDLVDRPHSSHANLGTDLQQSNEEMTIISPNYPTCLIPLKLKEYIETLAKLPIKSDKSIFHHFIFKLIPDHYVWANRTAVAMLKDYSFILNAGIDFIRSLRPSISNAEIHRCLSYVCSESRTHIRKISPNYQFANYTCPRKNGGPKNPLTDTKIRQRVKHRAANRNADQSTSENHHNSQQQQQLYQYNHNRACNTDYIAKKKFKINSLSLIAHKE